MKTLTTLTAVAALVAGISIAQAQNATGPGTSPSNVNAGSRQAGKSGSETMGAAMSKSGSKGKKTVTGTSAFCIAGASGSNSWNCKYKTMAACEKVAKPEHLTCAPNPNKSTTGKGMGSKSSMKSGSIKK